MVADEYISYWDVCAIYQKPGYDYLLIHDIDGSWVLEYRSARVQSSRLGSSRRITFAIGGRGQSSADFCGYLDCGLG